MGGALGADPEELAQLNESYGLEMQPETVPGLLERFGLRVGEPLSGGWRPERAGRSQARSASISCVRDILERPGMSARCASS